jgi:ABC-2 type transport system ATP-binding protein
MEVHHHISYLPERPYYYEHMTGLEILKFYGSLFGITDKAKFESLLEKVNLHRDMGKTISQYSKGMQQRIGLAQSLLNDPKLMFLDEPTGGLDPIAHREVRDLILSFRDEGRTVFISSHELSEVELICDRVAIINRGIIARQGKLTDLLSGGRIEITVEGVPESLVGSMSIKDANIRSVATGYLIDMPEENDPNSVIDAVRNAQGRVVSIVPRRKRLEDLFVETVTNKPRPAGEYQGATA